MSKFKKLKESYGMKVFNEEGYFFGEVEEAILEDNKIKSWKIKSLGGSVLEKNIKSAKGVIVPHTFLTAFGDIIIIKNIEVGGDTSKIVEPTKENF